MKRQLSCMVLSVMPLLLATFSVFAAGTGTCTSSFPNTGFDSTYEICITAQRNAQEAMSAQQALAEQQRAAAAERDRLGREAYLRSQAEAAAPKPKTADEIEKEQKQKWCADQRANLPLAKSRCESIARGNYSGALQMTCKNEISKTIQGGINVYIFGGTVSSTTSCSATYEAIMNETIQRCETDRLAVEIALNSQCK